MKAFTSSLVLGCLILLPALTVFAQNKESLLTDKTFSGIKLRSIGPAMMSGRIADIAIDPTDPNKWIVAVGSGGVWKTTNAGTTWKSVFDSLGSYSTGCVTIDAKNSLNVWVGTGENVGGRHVGYGDGIYRSTDGGETWENMGLKESQHISKIIMHPDNSNIVWVAAQGPLWNKGGDRGVYKTTDGGKTWKKVLGDDEWTGATNIVIDPRNPDLLYAATWQRHRNVAIYLGGGPGSGIHRSTDGGNTWEKLTNGLPKSNMGKIGLAISPQNPDVIYAAIELDRRTGGVFRSEDRGSTWEKRSNAVSGATGPHYYQELYASPHKFDRIYLVDIRIQISEDGGKTFREMKEEFKHSDNHAMAFRKDDSNYLLVGTDGGIYESFDLAENWRFIDNLPVTQFYKIALDDSEPFYMIYGGTQDNSTQGGPSQTIYTYGIKNSDWFLTRGWDGHQPATEPGNPNIVYSEGQEGHMSRIDRTTGEVISIQPQPEEGENYERFNWDSPILVSPFSSTRLYFASQRVWRSDNRGDSWKPISGDLTRNEKRFTLPIMDKNWSWDNAWDVSAMSNFNTITSLAESPLQEGLIYAGTDDGLINVTEDGGISWRRIEVGTMPDVPKTAFVNDIKADLFDVNTVYATLDNHKYGDLNSYLLKSTDRGKTWISIKGNIPGRTLVWRIVQDNVNPDLLFTATEFGVYFTLDGGKKWIKLTGGVPVISFRDLAIQRRENDLVCASFGRGIYILDDYSFLRNTSEEQLKKEATLFQPKKAWWYIPNDLGIVQGSETFTTPNPPFGAVFTYYLKDEYKTLKSIRQEKEKKGKISFPGWNELEKERREGEPKIWLTVKDMAGNIIRRVEGKNGKGFNRVAWDLRWPSTNALSDTSDIKRSSSGAMVAPGEYTVTLSKVVDGIETDLSGPMKFEVVRMYKGSIEGADPKVTAAFWQEVDRLNKSVSAASKVLRGAITKLRLMEEALERTPGNTGSLLQQLYDLKQELFTIDEQMNGNRSKNGVGEKNNPTVTSRLNNTIYGSFSSTYGPTETFKRDLEIAGAQFTKLKSALDNMINVKIPVVEKALIDAGAPWVIWQPIPRY